MVQHRGDLTGQILGSCRIEKLIGQGGMGAVYLARQLRPARHVAVKVLLPNLAMNSQLYQQFLARFRREADVVARLEHVNIMPIYEYDEHEGLVYLVMPYLTGGSLRDLLARRGALPLPEVIPYMQQAAAALDYAHAQGIIHRDLKPANFLLHADGRLVLADFGIARMMEDSASGTSLTGTGTFLGTPEYMAPEMARGEAIDQRADIYELGIVLFQMLSGHVPFSGNTPYAVIAKHVQEPLPRLHDLNQALPTGVDSVIQKATAKNREQRYTTAQAMVQDLQYATVLPPTSSGSYPQDNIATIISSSSAQRQQATPLYNTPALQQPVSHHTVPINEPDTSSAIGGRQIPAPSTNPPIAPVYATRPTTPSRRQQPLLLLVGILLALMLIVGGVLVGLQISKGASSPITNASPVATSTGGPAAQSTPQKGATATSLPTQMTPTTSTGITTGPLLYTAASPGQNCDTNQGTWTEFNGVKITCQGVSTVITNTSPSAGLQGIFLTGLPGKAYPANYVVQAQLQQNTQPAADFGLYFRNQPGNQQGVYTFLIHPDGTWGAYVYNNQTGAPMKLTGGPFICSHTP
ncbi:MAG TPA: serine/threonine-protein kinase, partial [Ktedonosporobacter sp.]|nr:serine/threonine-protein kinase [Ktedonosporobacter sp.]